MFDEPELHMIDISPDPDAQARWAEQRAEGRRRYVEEIVAALAESEGVADDDVGRAEAIFDRLFVVRGRGEDPEKRCHCSCHPQAPESDFHDYGFACPCRQTPEERRRAWQELWSGLDAYWRSPAGEEVTARRQAEEDALVSWLVAHPTVSVKSYGGACPEQWWGVVDGHSFYFRERHDCWRIELDLHPSGHFFRTLKASASGDADGYEMEESEQGDEIASGTVDDPGYGAAPVERIQFIVRLIRGHLRRQSCDLHPGRGDAPPADVDHTAAFCPACGVRL